MKTTLLVLIFAFPLFLNAQLTSDDFESYSTGVFDTQWDPADWVGWFGAFSNSSISDLQANSGSNSVLIQDNGSSQTDLIGLFGVLNSGIYEITFMQYIPGNNGAYYNLQHNYTNTAGDWAGSVWFSNAATNQAQINTNNTAFPFTPIHDQWVENRFVFNFAIDQAEFYYNGTLTHTWQITTNENGSAGLNQINAINLYATCLGTGCVSQAFYDDILVENIPLPDFDITLTEARRTGYTMVPAGFVQPFTFEADVFNAGAQTVNNVEVTAMVYDGSNTLVHTESLGNVGTLSSLVSNNFALVSTYTPPSSDDYFVEYIASMNEMDANPGDNEFSGTTSFAITDTVYARDDGNYTSGIGINGGTGIMGQDFDFISDASIKSIAMSYIGTGVGDTIVGHIYTTKSNGAPNALVASTEAFVLETPGGAGADVFVELNFSAPVSLTPENYAFSIEQKGTTNLLLSTSTEIFTPGATWATTDEGVTWNKFEDLGFSLALNIRPILDLTISVEEPSFIEGFTLSPNPTDGKATVNLELAETKDLILDVFNLQGQLIHTVRDYNVNGSSQYPLDLTTLANGIYLVRLTIDNQVASRKLNLTK